MYAVHCSSRTTRDAAGRMIGLGYGRFGALPKGVLQVNSAVTSSSKPYMLGMQHI